MHVRVFCGFAGREETKYFKNIYLRVGEEGGVMVEKGNKNIWAKKREKSMEVVGQYGKINEKLIKQHTKRTTDWHDRKRKRTSHDIAPICCVSIIAQHAGLRRACHPWYWPLWLVLLKIGGIWHSSIVDIVHMETLLQLIESTEKNRIAKTCDDHGMYLNDLGKLRRKIEGLVEWWHLWSVVNIETIAIIKGQFMN